MLVSALVAAGATALLTREPSPSVPDPLTPRELALLIDRAPALTPVPGGSAPIGPGARPAERPPRPTRIRIKGVGIDAPVAAVGLDGEALEVPRRHEAGWFADGPRPGEPGRTVLIGHLDSRRGPAVFGGVLRVRLGMAVTVSDAEGGVHRYRVLGGVQVRKHRFPSAEVFGASAEPLLVLVTCGGPFRPGRGYRDNLIVYARPA